MTTPEGVIIFTQAQTMPIYEYSCGKCGRVEVMQKITDKPLKRCPRCDGKVRKLVSHTSFHLKGTGWYLTDYARKDGSSSGTTSDKASATEAKSESKGGETASAETQTKPAQKKTTPPAASEPSSA